MRARAAPPCASMGSLYSKRGTIWMRIQIDGKWNGRPTGLLDTPENRKVAREVLRQREAMVALAAEAGTPADETITVDGWARLWLKRHKGEKSNTDDAGRWAHLRPLLGTRRLDDLRPRHVREALRELRKGELSARTIHHCYSVLRRMLREAKVDELVTGEPWTILKGDLPPKRDADPDWREGALFTPAEIVALVTSRKLPEDRRVFYAVLGYTGMRFGEAAELRWKDLAPAEEPLGRITLTRAISKGVVGPPKSGRSRAIPVHPSLAAVLAAWKLGGWARWRKRKPGPEDLVLPSRAGTHRLPQPTLRSLHGDLDTLKLDRRRVHDLRRSWITWARDRGSPGDHVRWIAHGPSQSVLDSYTSTPWAALCAVLERMEPPAAAEVGT